MPTTGHAADGDPRGPAEQSAARLALALAFVLPLGTYLATLARGLVWGDGVELAAVCATLGIAHPTGYPLFTLVGHGFTGLPVGTPASRVTLFCALSVAGSSWLLCRLLLCWIRRQRPIALGIPAPGLALAGALTFAWSLGPWSHATVTEVYAFELLIQLAVLNLAFGTLDRGNPGTLGLLTLALGLGMTHHLLTLTLFPYLVVGVWTVARQPRFRSLSARFRLGFRLFGLWLAGLLPLLYLPLRAAQSPRLNWGDPSSLERLRWTLTGGDYLRERWLVEQPGTPFDALSLGRHLLHRAADLATYLAGQLVAPQRLPVWAWLAFLGGGLWLLGLGWRWLFRQNRPFGLAWLASQGLYLVVLLAYNIRDIADYQLGLFAMLWPVLWIGLLETGRFGSVSLGSTPRAGRRGTTSRRWGRLVLVLPFTLLVANYADSDRSRDNLADLYASRLLSDLPRHAILLTEGDGATMSAWYVQEVEGKRRDVLVYCLNFLDQGWYRATFERRDLGGRRVGVAPRELRGREEFLAELRHRLIEPNIEGFPIFVLASPDLLRRLRSHYRLELRSRLLSDDELGAAVAAGIEPPPPFIFRLHPADTIDPGDRSTGLRGRGVAPSSLAEKREF